MRRCGRRVLPDQQVVAAGQRDLERLGDGVQIALVSLKRRASTGKVIQRPTLEGERGQAARLPAMRLEFRIDQQIDVVADPVRPAPVDDRIQQPRQAERAELVA